MFFATSNIYSFWSLFNCFLFFGVGLLILHITNGIVRNRAPAIIFITLEKYSPETISINPTITLKYILL